MKRIWSQIQERKVVRNANGTPTAIQVTKFKPVSVPYKLIKSISIIKMYLILT